MRYIWQHIQTIIETYNGSVPLTHFLRNYYKQYPKLGSRDRKILSEMAYCWYRCSKGFEEALPFEEKLKACLYLCETDNKHSLQFLPAHLQESKHQPPTEKIAILHTAGIHFDIIKITPANIELSEGIAKGDWLMSMLRQPMFFIRVRKNKEKIPGLLKENGLEYEIDGNCIALKNGVNIEKILPEDWYVVQDASSQQIGKYFHPAAGEQWWDCCSGAGGKSLLLKDIESKVKLTVSDKRATILHNLATRFKQYHHTLPEQYVLDASNINELDKKMHGKQFDHIICDVPCTGSGTWARTPEQLYYFDKNTVKEISKLQAAIAGNAPGYLKKGGTIYYITCSVFKEENERVVEDVQSKTGLILKEKHLLNGIEEKADSMFITILQKP